MSVFGATVYLVAFVGSVWALVVIVLGRATPLVFAAAAVCFGLGALYDVADGDALWAAMGGALSGACGMRAWLLWDNPAAWERQR